MGWDSKYFGKSCLFYVSFVALEMNRGNTFSRKQAKDAKNAIADKGLSFSRKWTKAKAKNTSHRAEWPDIIN